MMLIRGEINHNYDLKHDVLIFFDPSLTRQWSCKQIK